VIILCCLKSWQSEEEEEERVKPKEQRERERERKRTQGASIPLSTKQQKALKCAYTALKQKNKHNNY
jgi:hypothetical protein